MAKETKLNPYWLAGISAALLTAGWLMKSFPVFLLVGYAPLFALTDRISDKKPFWNQFEFILFALALSIFAANIFATESLLASVTQGIILTLSFIAFGFARQALGNRTVIFTIIFFWLAFEYVFLISPWRETFVYLADGFILQPQWLTFTQHTGYLGISLWILVCNVLVYTSYFKTGKFSWGWASTAGSAMVLPILLVVIKDWEPITRAMMINQYTTQEIEKTIYTSRGEWIARTGAWVSVLILLLSLVKNKTGKK